MATVEDLYMTFGSFCQFGSSRNLSGSMTDISGPTMDGSKWAKFCRDTGIIDKHITTTDIDIWFNKVKAKTVRKIDFEQFQAALHLVAAKRYGSSKPPTEAYNLLVRSILNSGARPVATGTITTSDSVTQRLTDHTHYTGTHKNRFDEAGQGLGLAGRDTHSRTNELSKIVNRKEADIRGVPLAASPIGSPRGSVTMSYSPKSKRAHAAVTTMSTEALDAEANRPKKAVTSQAPRTVKPIVKSSETLLNTTTKKTVGASSGNVFDRLTNTKGYTGTHKERFHGSSNSIHG